MIVARTRGPHAVLLVLLGGACEAVAPEPSVRTLAVTGGAPDTDHLATAALVTVSPLCGALGPPPAPFCTGTLVAPRVLLTAAHCLDESLLTTTRVVFGARVDAADAAVARPVRAYVHPDHESGRNDVALLVLDEAVALAPVALASAALGQGDVGRTVTVVGFGLDDTGPAGVTGTRRGGTARISAVSAEDFTIVAAPAMSCGGDSGGPVFVDQAGTEVVAGITSTGGPTCRLGLNERVDAFRGFLDAAIAEVQASPPPARPALDPARDYCAAGCASDGDCPLGMACAGRKDGSRSCGLGGLPPGSFGASCTDACEGGTCVGAAGGCRCWRPCDRAPAASPGPPAGCAAGASRPAGGLAVLALLALLARRGRPVQARGPHV